MFLNAGSVSETMAAVSPIALEESALTGLIVVTGVLPRSHAHARIPKTEDRTAT
jgi:hypothetical protein